MRFASIFVPNNGPEQAVPDIFDPNSPPFITPSVGTLGLKWTEEVIRFALGERVILAPKVLTEVLLFSHQCTIGLIKSAEDFARANGVQEASGSSL
jgi:hypothetical protein